jgi:hypothetical protein
VTLRELLARVNTEKSSPSGNQQHSDGGRKSWIGENKDYGDFFGDFITKKKKCLLRIGIQNIGGFPVNRKNIMRVF